jgi:uncharacterized protein (TIGR02117 family)
VLSPRRAPRWRTPAIVFGAVILAIVLALGFQRPGDRTLYPSAPGQPTVSVYLIDNGYHTNIVVPTDQLRAHGGALAAALGALAPSPWTEIGWGDEKFYIQTGVSGGRAFDGFRALFAPRNPSAVMLGPLRAAPDRIWTTGVTRLALSPAGLERMLTRIDGSFVLRGGGPVVLPGGEDGVRFFKSGEYFSILHICNHWTSERLNAAGIPMRPVLDTLPAGLLFDLETEGATVHSNAAVAPRPN